MANTGPENKSEDVPRSLSGIKIFFDLGADELRTAEKACRWKLWAAGEQVLDRQMVSRDVYFIVKGSVRVANYSFSGQMITFDDISTGEYFGELAALDGKPRSASVVVEEDALLASLSPDRFLEIVCDHPALALDLMRRLTSIIRKSDERIMDLSTLGAQNRVHAEILRLAREASKDGKSAEIKPPLHADLAGRVSTARETVARAISDLAGRGLVERGKGSLVIHDLERLGEMVEAVRGEERRESAERRHHVDPEMARHGRRVTDSHAA